MTELNPYAKNLDARVRYMFEQAQKGNIGPARQVYANFLREGAAKNPRAYLYQFACTQKDITAEIIEQGKILRKNGQKQAANELVLKYLETLKNVFNVDSHPLTFSAVVELSDSMNKIYPNLKTRKFTKFICLKQDFPILGKLKFLARIL